MQLGTLSGDGVEYIDQGRWAFEGLHHRPAACRLQVLKKDDTALVLWTELADNPGASVTNASENLAMSVVREFNLNPHKCLFVEHYEKDRHSMGQGTEESYDIVSYEWEGIGDEVQPYRARNAAWERLQNPDAGALLVRLVERSRV